MTLPYPPPWQDLRTLALHLCAGESTVEKWVREGRLPASRMIGGKRMWRWSEVDRRLAETGTGVQSSPDQLAESIRNATRMASQGR